MVHRDVGYIHTGSRSRVGHNFSKGVVANLAHQSDTSTQTGALHRLVGTLSTGSRLELQADYGLARVRYPFRGGNQIHHEAAYHEYIWLFQHA